MWHWTGYNTAFDLTLRNTVFIRISAQPRISAHLEEVSILKAEKVNKRPASIKRSTNPLALKLK